jgi:hypothetical protein
MPNESRFDYKIIVHRQGELQRPILSGVHAMHFFSGRKGLVGLASVDRKPAFWKYGEMKTTLDLPDDLMREVKIRAVHEHKKLKDAIAEFIRKGMAAGKTRAPKLPKPVKLRGGFKPTTEDIEAAIAWGRD